jgi:chromosome segregation ATPase
MPLWLQAVTALSAILAALVAAGATVRSKRLETAAQKEIAAANARAADAERELRERELAHKESDAIWQDATALREELRRERASLLDEREALRRERAALLDEVTALRPLRGEVESLREEVRLLRESVATLQRLACMRQECNIREPIPMAKTAIAA